MMYSDVDIRGAMDRALLEQGGFGDFIRVSPEPEPDQYQPASIDLRLGRDFVCFTPIDYVDMKDRNCAHYHVNIGSNKDSYFELAPKTLVLGTTIERVELGPCIWGRIEGKSSMGRIGLVVHVTAGFIDPGFAGQLTLELYNLSATPIRLRPEMAICQVAFGELKSPADRPYGSTGLGSHYQDQQGATAVRL